MKKMLVILLLVCLALGGAIAYTRNQGGKQPGDPPAAVEPAVTQEPADAAVPAANAAQEPADGGLQMEEMDYQTLDMDRLYATRDPQEIVVTVNGKAVNWGDYFYFLDSQVNSVEKMLVRLYANYGAELLWSDLAEGDSTYADLAVNGAEESMRQLAAIEDFAEENGLELTEENKNTLAQKLKSDIKRTCGEDATEEEFEAYLAKRHMSRALYDRINSANVLYQEGFRLLYGENGEALGDDAALQYLEDNGYLSAGHILLLTMDPATGEELDETLVAEKAATAQRLAEELQAVKDPAELLERFARLKEEYCEDSGKTVYAEGYTFTPHTMAAEFEAACKALEPYEVSDPVLSKYGYHIIMRLPPDADALLFSSKGDPVTARTAAASAEYNERLQVRADGLEADYAEGFEKPNLLDYILG